MQALALALALLLPATPVGSSPPAAAHAQNAEAFAASDIRKSAPTAIVALTVKQHDDPVFHLIANQLGETLSRQGFNMVMTGQPYRNVVTLDFVMDRDIDGNLPGQATDDPKAQTFLGPAALPSHRRLTVTAYALVPKRRPELLWRTVMEEDGFDFSVARTVPTLVKAGAAYYGRNLTQLAVADCDDFHPPIGSHIPTRACGEVRAKAFNGVARTPQVTVETAPTPADPH